MCRSILATTDAEDAWSETFLSALTAYHDLPDDGNIEAWLVTIAHHRAIDIIRVGSRQTIPTDTLPEPTDVPDPERYSDLMHALARLPDKQRQAVVYHYLAGLPHAVVAHVCSGTTDAARRAAADGIAALPRSFRGEPAATLTSRKGAHSCTPTTMHSFATGRGSPIPYRTC